MRNFKKSLLNIWEKFEDLVYEFILPAFIISTIIISLMYYGGVYTLESYLYTELLLLFFIFLFSLLLKSSDDLEDSLDDDDFEDDDVFDLIDDLENEYNKNK